MPKVLTTVNNILSSATTDSRRMLLWDRILDSIQHTADRHETAKNLFDAHKSGDFYTDLEDQLHKIWSPDSRSSFRKNDDTPPKEPKRVKLPEKKEEDEHYYYTDPEKPQSHSLVVCLDEVTGLSNEIFRAYRRVAKQRGLLSIFADTATSICRLARTNDHSSADHNGNLGKFVKPLFALETIDIDMSVNDRLNVADDDYVSLFCAGRPLWRTHLNDNEDINTLLKFAENLLTQSKEEDDENLKSLSKLDYTGINNDLLFVDYNLIAVFACRFAMGRESRMAPLLAKHSLATVVGIADDRSTVFTSYPSEPILAEVSSRYTNQNTNRKLVLHEVRCAFNNRTKLLDPPTGDVGEMCAAALLGYLMDLIRVDQEHTYMCQPVPLLHLLQFFGADRNGPSKVTNDWEVNFTHFIRPDDDPTNGHFNIMWKRRVAYYVPEGCDGLDLLVVIKHKSGGYGTLRIQVKNYSTKIATGEVNKILSKLLPQKCLPNPCNEKLSVGLLLCVGDVDERCDLVRYNDGRRLDTRSSPRGPQDPEEQQQLLHIAAKFPVHHSDQNVKELALTLKDIARRHQNSVPDHASKRYAKYFPSKGSIEET